ncbi:MAG: PepSY-like domain-containing protein [Bacteroidales bacterium]
MKKFILLTICVAFFAIYCVQAQEKSKKVEVPSTVKSAFEAKYPKAEKVNWGLEKQGEYEAEFVLNGIESSANFDSKGQFLEFETEIKESELPQSIKATLSKNFAGYKIGEVAKSTNDKGIVNYEMEASKGKDKFEISFDANGKLLNKKTSKGGDEGNDKK